MLYRTWFGAPCLEVDDSYRRMAPKRLLGNGWDLGQESGDAWNAQLCDLNRLMAEILQLFFMDDRSAILYRCASPLRPQI